MNYYSFSRELPPNRGPDYSEEEMGEECAVASVLCCGLGNVIRRCEVDGRKKRQEKVFQVTTVNYFGGGESFHQTATYLTVEAEGKEIPFLFEYLQRVGGRSDFFFNGAS